MSVQLSLIEQCKEFLMNSNIEKINDGITKLFSDFWQLAMITWETAEKDFGFENLVQIYLAAKCQEITRKCSNVKISQGLNEYMQNLTEKEKNVLKVTKQSIKPDLALIINGRITELVEIKFSGSAATPLYKDLKRLIDIKEIFGNKIGCALLTLIVDHKSLEEYKGKMTKDSSREDRKAAKYLYEQVNKQRVKLWAGECAYSPIERKPYFWLLIELH